MTIAEIHIENTFGIEALDIKPGTVTVISGANGVGKTSFLNSLRALFEGGSNPGIIRRGAKKSVVKITLSTGETFQKETTPSGYKLIGIGADGLIIPSPQAALNALADAGSVSPAALLAQDATTAAGRKALAQALLAAMPIEVSYSDLRAAVPVAELLPGKPPNPDVLSALEGIAGAAVRTPLDLDELARLRKSVEETRRIVSGAMRDADGTIRSLSAALPSAEDAGAAKVRAAEIEAEIKELWLALEVESGGIRDDHAREERQLREQFQADLLALTDKKTAAMSALGASVNEKLDPLRDETAALTEKIAAANRAAGARESLKGLEAKRKQDSERHTALTSVLEVIDAAKRDKLAALPIPGMEITADSVSVGGIAWSAINLAQRATIVVQIVSMLSGPLSIMILDDCEHLDDITWGALRCALIEAGFQIFTGWMKPGLPLTIEGGK